MRNSNEVEIDFSSAPASSPVIAAASILYICIGCCRQPHEMWALYYATIAVAIKWLMWLDIDIYLALGKAERRYGSEAVFCVFSGMIWRKSFISMHNTPK